MDRIEWLEPWQPAERGQKAALERQLFAETSRGHVLWGESAVLVATCIQSDDALFLLPDGRVAQVHLTWSGTPERDPQWPHTEIFGSLDDWAERRMASDHLDWTS
ncbi:MAG: hypothetical protein AB7O49_08800 [Sphingomonadales bacterium]